MSFKMEFGYPKEAEKAKKEGWPVLIPIGTMEYHSTICPYGCDTLIAMGIAEKCVNLTTVTLLFSNEYSERIFLFIKSIFSLFSLPKIIFSTIVTLLIFFLL